MEQSKQIDDNEKEKEEKQNQISQNLQNESMIK